MPNTRRRLQPAFAIVLVLLGSAGAAALWTLLAVAVERHSAWMAVVCALDVVLLLRMSGAWAGTWRALVALLATMLAIALANWWITGAEVGQMVGLLPWDSIPRLGWAHGWTLLKLVNGNAEFAWYGVALIVAAVGGAWRDRPRAVSDRRPAPSAH